jgi:hypothetical protein
VSGPRSAATGLGFARFFFPLLKPVLGMRGQPAIRQQSLQGSRIDRSDGRNSTQHVGQVRPHVNTVSAGALHYRVERGPCLPALLTAEVQTVLATNGDSVCYVACVKGVAGRVGGKGRSRAVCYSVVQMIRGDHFSETLGTDQTVKRALTHDTSGRVLLVIIDASYVICLPISTC